MKKILISIVLCAVFQMISAQRTVGLLSYKPWKSYDGYNLIYPHNQPNVILLNNCGEIVHTWESEEDRRPGNTAYILENGNVVMTSRSASVTTDPIWAGGGGERVEIRSWDNEILWSFERNDAMERLHHDITILPNGNIAMIVWEYITEEDAIAAGRDTSLLSQDALWPDKIIEVNPSTDEIVWEWRSWDHLIQDYDETKANYGIIADHPERINLNWDTNDGKADWLHSNALDYDPVNDHMILSVPQFHEMWVIDHSTTTEQAAGSTGGFSGKGGDLIYRWGNPQTYDRGTADNQQFFYQHDVHFIDDFLLPSHPYYGKYAIFNNRVGDDFSSVVIIDNVYDMYDATFAFDGDTYAPSGYALSKTHPIPQNLYSTGLSSIQVLPNDNLLITDGRNGYSFEMTPDDEIVWEYVTPLKMGFPVNQGDTLELNNNLTFRMKRYPVDFSGFENRDLEGKGFIELDGNEEFCNNILPTKMSYENDALALYPNPVNGLLTVQWETSLYEELSIYNALGQQMWRDKVSGGRTFIDVSSWQPGYYIIKTGGEGIKTFIVTE